MRTLMLLFVLIPFVIYAQGDSWQTDWSEGPGVPGPVNQWLYSFDSSEGVNYWALANNNPALELNQYDMITVAESFSGGASIASADIDNDGDIDLIATSASDNSIHWWENVAGNGLVWDEHSITEDFPGCFAVYVADVDGDGFMDVASAARITDELAWWQNPGVAGEVWTKHQIASDFVEAFLIRLVDIDGDGDLDAIASGITENTVHWFENTDEIGESWSQHLVYDLGDMVRSIEGVDIDNDGDMDITAAGGSVMCWLNNIDGTGTTWSLVPVTPPAIAIIDLIPFDMDNDGDVDLLGVKESGYWQESCWENTNGLGTAWVRHELTNYASGSRRVFAADINQDGWEDAVTISQMEGSVKAWENIDGTGTDWNRTIINWDFLGALDVTCADFNGNGVPDIAGVSNNGTIAWWQHTPFPESGWLESSIEHNPGNLEYTSFEAYGVEPPGTSITYYLRGSDDPNDMGDWVGSLTPPCDLSEVLAGTEYLQYKVLLTTDDPLVTPRLNTLHVYWYYLGIEGNPESFALLGPDVNPSPGTASVRFSLPWLTEVQFSVFDLSGRKCFEFQPEEYSRGINQLNLPDLPPGIYILQMVTEDFTDNCRIVRVN